MSERPSRWAGPAVAALAIGELAIAALGYLGWRDLRDAVRAGEQRHAEFAADLTATADPVNLAPRIARLERTLLDLRRDQAAGDLAAERRASAAEAAAERAEAEALRAGAKALEPCMIHGIC